MGEYRHFPRAPPSAGHTPAVSHFCYLQGSEYATTRLPCGAGRRVGMIWPFPHLRVENGHGIILVRRLVRGATRRHNR